MTVSGISGTVRDIGEDIQLVQSAKSLLEDESATDEALSQKFASCWRGKSGSGVENA